MKEETKELSWKVQKYCADAKKGNLFIYQARQSLAWSQQGFWQPSFCGKLNLGSLCFDWGNWVVLLLNASLKERGSIMKLKGWKMDSSPLVLFSFTTMQRNFTLVLPWKQSLGNSISYSRRCWVWEVCRIFMRERPHMRGNNPTLTIPSPNPNLQRRFYLKHQW